MPTEPSKYAENQFDSATEDSASLMSEILADVMPRILAASIAHAELIPANNLLISMNAAWDAAETILANAEAGQFGATFAFEDKLRSLTRQPEGELGGGVGMSTPEQSPNHRHDYESTYPRNVKETLNQAGEIHKMRRNDRERSERSESSL